jgi:regulator of protease activity HflC (stomatin/prohibitin superfamily)
MHVISKMVGALALVMGLTGCATIPAGYRGVKVYYYGDSDGNEVRELGIGRYAYSPATEEIYKFPVFQQNVAWQRPEGGVRFQTNEGLSVGVDVGMSYQIDETKVTKLFQTYRRGIEEITDTFLRHIVADACSRIAATMSVEEVYGAKKELFLQQVNDEVRKQVAPVGIKVEQIHLIGEFRLPPAVVEAIDRKIAASQRAQQRENELRENEAEAANRVALARGAAEVQRIEQEMEARGIAALSERLSVEFLLYQAIQRWDGKLPQSMMGPEGTMLTAFARLASERDGSANAAQPAPGAPGRKPVRPAKLTTSTKAEGSSKPATKVMPASLPTPSAGDYP